jgi:hypothetical protein
MENVEIVFSGLCAFHNLHGQHPDLLEPSVIMVRTDGVEEAGEAADEKKYTCSARVAAAISDRWKRPRKVIDKPLKDQPSLQGTDVHISHLSFDATQVRVDVASQPLFQQVPMAPGFLFIPLNGVEIEIENDPAGLPDVDQSYDQFVVKKDTYWPEARGKFNPDFIPEKGKQPKRSAVVSLMRFGSGTIKAGNLSPVQWKFDRNGQRPLVGTFAEEVIYSGFPHSGDEVVVHLRDIDTREIVRTLRFSPITPEITSLTLFIGNNDVDDIDNAVQRIVPGDVRDNNHFRFLNRIASIPDPGRIPKVVPRPPRPSSDDDDSDGPVGGISSGPCGPIGTNG